MLLHPFGARASRDYIRDYYWGGFDNGYELLEQARSELAHTQGIEYEAVLDKDVEVYAETHYLTPSKVNARLDSRYGQGEHYSLFRLREVAAQHELEPVVRACDGLKALDDLHECLPEMSSSYFEMHDGYFPNPLVITLGEADDLVMEMCHEYESMVWQSGEYMPFYALAFSPDNAHSLERLACAFDLTTHIIHEAEALLRRLEAYE